MKAVKIIAVVLAILIVVGIIIYVAKSNAEANSKKPGQKTYDNPYGLSAQDLATYNDLPTDAAKQEFINAVMAGSGQSNYQDNGAAAPRTTDQIAANPHGLSEQDLAAYNSIPDEAGRQQFLKDVNASKSTSTFISRLKNMFHRI